MWTGLAFWSSSQALSKQSLNLSLRIWSNLMKMYGGCWSERLLQGGTGIRIVLSGERAAGRPG
jgi:hypothetical protein